MEPPSERRQSPRSVVRSSGQVLAGSHVGDRRLRLDRRPETHTVPVPERSPRHRSRNPWLVFVYGVAGLIALGTLVLLLPFASASGDSASVLVALFTATSAVCGTGLVAVDTGTYWSGFGQAVILVLIQLGGLGFMTSTTLFLLLLRREATLRERILLREALGSGGLGSVLHLARRIVLFTVVFEAAGTLVLASRFLAEMHPLQALWWGLFHAVSAFNNAGFDIVGRYRSLTPYSHDAVVLLAVGVLIVIGGISYTVFEDVMRRRDLRRLTLDSKLVLLTTAALLPLGTLALLLTEWNNAQTLGGMAPGARLLNAFFQSVTPRAAGFSSVDIGQMSEDGLFVLMTLMFIGGAAGSTASGIKVQTFSLLFFAIVSAVRGATEVEAFNRRVPLVYVLRAMSVALLSIAVIMVISFLLNAIEPQPFLPVLFETVSAFGTGLSTGITPELTPPGRVLLIFTMFAGRLGPLTLVLALASRERRTRYRWPEEAVKIG